MCILDGLFTETILLLVLLFAHRRVVDGGYSGVTAEAFGEIVIKEAVFAAIGVVALVTVVG